MAIIPCRFPGYDGLNDDGSPQYFIDVPRWTGKHADIEEEAVNAAKAAGLTGRQFTFAVSIALFDDYRLPGMEGKKWDFSLLPLEIIAWVNIAGYQNYLQSFIVEKKFFEPLPTG